MQADGARPRCAGRDRLVGAGVAAVIAPVALGCSSADASATAAPGTGSDADLTRRRATLAEPSPATEASPGRTTRTRARPDSGLNLPTKVLSALGAKCDGSDDTATVAAAVTGARHNAYALVVDCPATLDIGLNVDRSIFIDDDTTVVFQGAGKFTVNNLFEPAFAIVDTSNVTFVQANFDFYAHTLRGVPELSPRWKRCVSVIDEQLGEALGEEFVRRAFTEETKKQALAKLHAVVNKIGYPERFRDYGAVRISRDEWLATPPTVDAYYNAQMNDINFPAGVLQPPLFDAKLDDAPNYGNTGSTIGHELTHAFDDKGRQFDGRGNLRNWWTKKDAASFDVQAGCVVSQYAQYTVIDEVHINSKLTEGEDVADLGGTMLAFLAWKHATAGTALGSVDGLTPDQRFFVGFAQWDCMNDRPEDMRLRAVTNSHSPARYRIDGVAANMPEFATAFACRAGQPMAPASRCKVW